MNKRFSITTIKSENTGETITIIVDNNSTKTLKSDYGDSTTKYGYVRNVGREFIGFFGNNEVFEGHRDDILYYPYFCFEGNWSSSSDSPAIRETGGKGVLWQSLENFYKETKCAK